MENGEIDFINMNIFLLGAYGQKNTGDESLLLVFKKEIEKRGHNIVVNSHFPKETEKQYGVKSVFTYPWKQPLKKLKTLIWADAVVYGGGTILSQIPKMLFFMMIGNFTAKLLGKKVTYIGVGVGNLQKSKLSQLLVKRALKFADLITLRDKESYQQLKGVSAHRKARVTADPVLLLSGNLQPGKDNFQFSTPNSQFAVGISFRYVVEPGHYEFALSSLAKLAQYLQQKHQAKIILLPIHHPIKYSQNFNWKYDLQACQELQQEIEKLGGKAVLIDKELTPQQVKTTIGKFSLYIGSPLHALMFAALENTPMIALDYASSYNRKVEQFISAIGQKDYYIKSYQNCDFETLKKMSEESIKKTKQRKAVIERNVSRLKQKAASNFALLEKELLG